MIFGWIINEGRVGSVCPTKFGQNEQLQKVFVCRVPVTASFMQCNFLNQLCCKVYILHTRNAINLLSLIMHIKLVVVLEVRYINCFFLIGRVLNKFLLKKGGNSTNIGNSSLLILLRQYYLYCQFIAH